MNKILNKILVMALLMVSSFSLASCFGTYGEVRYHSTDDQYEVTSAGPNVDYEIVVRYGTPYYYQGDLIYYLYNGMYYYPYYYNNYWYFRTYRVLPYPSRPWYRPSFGRPHRGDIRHHHSGYDRGGHHGRPGAGPGRGHGRHDGGGQHHPRFGGAGHNPGQHNPGAQPGRRPDARPQGNRPERRPDARPQQPRHQSQPHRSQAPTARPSAPARGSFGGHSGGSRPSGGGSHGGSRGGFGGRR